MKSKKHRNRSRNVPNPVARGFPSGYEPSFKRAVILYAEQKSNSEARKRYGISEETIRRWRKLKREILEMAQQCVRRSQRHAYTAPSTSTSQAVSESPPVKKEKDKEKDKGGEEQEEKDDFKTDLDSMPLQQRLSQNHNEPQPSTPTQEPVLQSQPISPTKLKVTRQGAKPHQPPAKPPTPPPPNPEVCLRWNSHHTNMQVAFPNLLTKEQYVDATLVSEGKTLKCHRMILSSCSPYFEEVLNGISPFQHPVLFMKDIPFWILKALCDFMYAGEVHIFQDKLQEILNVAEILKIKGLAGTPDTKEEITPVMPEIKQEIDATPPPKVVEKPLKEEKEEEPPPPPPPKPARHETAKPSKKKEDKKSKHSNQTPKEKEKEKVVEELPLKGPPKVPPKIVIPKMATKVVAKVVLPKMPPPPKTTVRNVMKTVLQKVPKPSTSKTTHTSRKSDTSKKSDKHKADVSAQKEKEKEKEKPPLKKDNINDPLDLLQPVYEEIAKEDPPPMIKSISPAKLKERGNVPVKKGVNKKVKKRRYAEYAEEREESPPPVFSSRKGTRSRPHVKIPKFFHTHYEETQKETTDATIVREPHTDQSDPLIGVEEEVEEIKAEPLDVEEDNIEMEENLVNYMQEQEMTSQEGEEIIGNYDSPIVNIKQEGIKRNTPNIFKKILDPQPVIVNIHTVTEGSQPSVGLLNINQDTLKIVDIAKISKGQSRVEETIIGTSGFDAIPRTQDKTSEIMISNVQSMAECEENRLKGSEVPKEGEVEREERLLGAGNIIVRSDMQSPSLKCEEALSSTLNPSETEINLVNIDPIALRIKIENVQSDNSQDGQESLERHVENETELASTVDGTLNNQEQRNTVVVGSLGDKIEFSIVSQDPEGARVDDGHYASTVSGSLDNQEQRNRVVMGSLGSLGDKIGEFTIVSQDQEGARAADDHHASIVSDSLGNQEQRNRVVMGSLGSLGDKIEAFSIVSQDPKSARAADDHHTIESNIARGNQALVSERGVQECEDIGARLKDENSRTIHTTQSELDVGEVKEERGEDHQDPEGNMLKTQRLEDTLETAIGETGTSQVNEQSNSNKVEQMEYEETMPLAPEREKRLEPVPDEAGYSVQETERVEGDEYCCSGKIQKTVEGSDIGIEREGIPALPSDIPPYYEEELHRGAVQSEDTAPASIAPESASKPVAGEAENKPDPDTPVLSHHAELTQKTIESEEMMSLGSQSQELMSVDPASQQLTSISTETHELQVNERLLSPRINEEIRESNLESTVKESETLNQEIRHKPRELETGINVEDLNPTVQEGAESDERSFRRIESQGGDEYHDEQSTSLIVREENLISRESEAKYWRNNVQNTSEMIPVSKENRNIEPNVGEEALPEHETKPPEYFEDVERCKETETAEKMSVDYVSQEMGPQEGPSESTESAVLELQRDDNIRTNKVVEEGNVESAENVKETTENIEAELEQCLASTSDIAPRKLGEEKLKLNTPRLPFEDDEDFTKDIEFNNFIGRNRPANYLSDFNDDFEMEDIGESRTQRASGEPEEERNAVSEAIEASSDKMSLGEKGDGDETKTEVKGASSDNTILDEGGDGESKALSEGGDGESKVLSDRGALYEDKLAESGNTEKASENVGDNLVAREDCEGCEEQNINKDIQTSNPDLERTSSPNQNIESRVDVGTTSDEHSSVVQKSPQIPENFNEHPDSTEDEQKLEDRLLADLDDDIEMAEPSTSDQADNGAEKTLEMIVNDLNKSLGELRK